MPTKQQPPQNTGEEQLQAQHREAGIAQQVLDALGQPENLQRVQIRPLWEGRYRVNILVGLDTNSARVASSYFLVVDGKGSIVTSTPSLTRED